MSKPTELKVAADIIRRVLEAAERGDIDLLNQAKQALRKKSTEKSSDLKAQPAKQTSMEYGRYGQKFTEKDVLDEINRFSDLTSLRSHLKDKYVTRADIDAVSRSLSIPVPKSLDYEGVIERVIEATLGYKLRSQAVRGEFPDKKRLNES